VPGSVFVCSAHASPPLIVTMRIIAAIAAFLQIILSSVSQGLTQGYTPSVILSSFFVFSSKNHAKNGDFFLLLRQNLLLRPV
jgi:hypothetical protein